ncbi:serpin family protein [Microlunatus endophyticus]|uniref:serpin family protein n=1 Tax=Microlunatus endophyticus TaxID=1716077 RepID=UPI001665C166|nr:serpin family protein [Microlunatus endophyticus]
MITSAPRPALLPRRVVLAAALGGLVGSPFLAGCGRDPITSDMVRANVDRNRPDAMPTAATVDSLTRFGAEISSQAQAGSHNNFLCSPLSLWLALAMTRNGAAGRTAAEMDKALRFGDLAGLNQGLNTTSQLLAERSGKQQTSSRTGKVALRIANQLFGDQTFSKDPNAWRRPFLAAVARYYGTGMALADFQHKPADAQRRINDWVADQTNDKITKLLPDGMITGDTRLVLVNALYLAAPWLEKFAAAGRRPFHRHDSVVPADMMRISMDSGTAKTMLGTVVRIPYLGNQLAMTVMLPAPGREAAVRDRLVRELPGMLGQLAPAQVILTMPKFSYRTTIDVKLVLRSRGMELAFSDSADFSLMSPQPLKITDIAHQCTIGVDEEGTEASAATAVVLDASSGSSARPIEITLDRPFWYVIHDLATKVPLFVGYLADPTAS